MLTNRQKQFADAYLLGGDPHEAFRKAGYREKNVQQAAKRLLAAPAVKQYIEDKLTVASEGRVADPTEILQYLTAVLRGEHGSDRERLRAAELLGKRHGLFSDTLSDRVAAVMIVDDLNG